MGHFVSFPNRNTVGDERAHFPARKLSLKTPFDAIKSIIWYLLVELLALGFEDLRHWRFRKFIKNYLQPNFYSNEWSGCDCVVVGSDQIWNPVISGSDTPLFLGESVPAEIPRISYAASCGDVELPTDYAQRLSSAARTFNALSVREIPRGVTLLDRNGRSPVQVVDPTFLVGVKDFKRYEEPRRLVEGRYLFLYVVNNCPEIFKIAEMVSKLLKIKLVAADSCQRGLWRSKLYEDMAVSPDRFLAYVRDADYVITNSFHGAAFSLIYEKRFVVLPSASTRSSSSRIVRLLDVFSCGNRLLPLDADLDSLKKTLNESLPHDLNNQKARLRTSSLRWIQDSLDCYGLRPQ